MTDNLGRIYFRTNSTDYFVSHSGTGDYSDYFRTEESGLTVGEIVALDPSSSRSVRRARPYDTPRTIGIVSRGGTRNNDNLKGSRGCDPDYINVGLLGQVPVLVSLENGPIQPGDALTLSSKILGRAVKATGPCRIIGYAMTHFPFVQGEVTWQDDVNGSPELKLKGDHVMCFVDPTWYDPTGATADQGVDPEPLENDHSSRAREVSVPETK